MKRRKNSLWVLLLSLLALGAWVSAAFLAQRAEALSAGVLVRWAAGEGVSPAQRVQALRWAAEDGAEDAPAVTLWRERPDQSVKAGDRTAGALVLEFCGRGEDLWPAAFLAGNYPAAGDLGGCALDRTLAEALWGTGRVLGRAVKLDGRTYYVRGVFEGDGGVLLVRGSEDGAEPWPNLYLNFGGGDAKEQAEQFLTRNQWGGGTVLDLPVLSWGLSVLSALPGALLALGVLLRLLRRGRRLAGMPVLLAAYLPAALLGAAGALWCAGFPPQVPGQLIPTRWADFDFWTRLFAGRAAEVGEFLAMAPGARDGRFWPLALGCVLLSLTAAALVILAAERAEARSLRTLVLGWSAAVGGTFALALAFAGVGGVAVSRSLWLMPCLWLAVDWALGRHADTLRPRGGDGDARVET